MKANWEECKYIEQRQVAWAGLYATLTRHGEIRMGARTWQKLGEPRAVRVYFDKANQRFALMPTQPGVANAFPVNKKGHAGSRLVPILGVLRDKEIDVPETIRFFDAEINDEGALLLDLRTARVPPSVSSHPRNIARNART
jgi:hypothetical protein